MRRIALLMMLALSAAGCRSGPRGGGGDNGAATGAADSRSALDAFLGSVRAQDLQAMSRLWGGPRGLARDVLSREQLEQRELLIMCHMGHDSYSIVSEHTDSDGRRVYLVRLRRGSQSRETTFKMYRSGADRWYVEEADMNPVRDFCDRMPGR